MLVVNTTYHVSETVEEEWKTWVREEYIPLVTTPGMLVRPRFQRLLVENEPGQQCYALQFEVEDLDTLDSWFQNHGKKMQKNLSDKFQEKVLGFTTLMEIIDLD